MVRFIVVYIILMYELKGTYCFSGKPVMDSILCLIFNYVIKKVVYFIFAILTVIS
jgi:hypothetical protein